jgi:hypothetical protein
MRKLLAAPIVLIALALSIPAASAAKPKPELQCGVTPTTDVVLTHDLTCASGFELYAHPVRIDLGGHTLTGSHCSGGPCPDGTIGGALEVSNGTVNGDLSNDQKIDHVTVNGVIHMGESFDFNVNSLSWRLTHSTVNGLVDIQNSRATVDHNRIDGRGIWVDDALSGTGDERIQRNTITGGGIYWVGAFDRDFSGEITGNTISDVDGPGLSTGPSTPGPLTITGNRLVDNQGDGIEVVPDDITPRNPVSVVVLKRNTATGNGGHGINAPGVTDGGRNRAFANGADPQCVGVICRAK